jgi:hypothetical protein
MSLHVSVPLEAVHREILGRLYVEGELHAFPCWRFDVAPDARPSFLDAAGELRDAGLVTGRAGFYWLTADGARMHEKAEEVGTYYRRNIERRNVLLSVAAMERSGIAGDADAVAQRNNLPVEPVRFAFWYLNAVGALQWTNISYPARLTTSGRRAVKFPENLPLNFPANDEEATWNEDADIEMRLQALVGRVREHATCIEEARAWKTRTESILDHLWDVECRRLMREDLKPRSHRVLAILLKAGGTSLDLTEITRLLTS